MSTSIESDFDKARKFLAEIEDLVVNQKDLYVVHQQRLEGVKFLWERVQRLRQLEMLESTFKQQQQEEPTPEPKLLEE